MARAGRAVAAAAVDMLGGTYGRRVVVVAGKGNNGADGRYAAGRLRPAGRPGAGRRRRRRARAARPPARPGDRRRLRHRVPGRVPGARPRRRARARRRHPVGRRRAHRRRRAGCGAGRPHRHLRRPQAGPPLPPGTGAGRAGRRGRHRPRRVRAPPSTWSSGPTSTGGCPARPVDTHKWKSAVWVVAGSPGMTGAAHLCARAAMRAGAGTVRLGIPGVAARPRRSSRSWAGRSRPRAGTTTCSPTSGGPRRWSSGPASGAPTPPAPPCAGWWRPRRCPSVVDADGLYALGTADEAAAVLGDRTAPTVLTPHDGEFERLAGHPPGADRIAAARDLAARTARHRAAQGADDGRGRPVGRGAALAPRATSAWPPPAPATCWPAWSAPTWPRASTACGRRPAAAFVHGRAGHLGWRHGLVAGDLLDLLPAVLDRR